MSLSQRHYKWAGITLMILGLGFVLLWGYRVIKAVTILKANGQIMQEMMGVDNPLAIDQTAITSLLESTRQSVVILHKDTALILELAPALGWLPKVGPFLEEMPDLLNFADLGTQTAVQLWDYLLPTYDNIQKSGMDISLLTDLVTVISPDIVPLQISAQKLSALYRDIDPEAIPWRYQNLFMQVGPPLSLYANGLSIVDDIPQLIGVEKPSTFLVMALNEDELRAGGGFISGVGELVMQEGKIKSMEFRDSYQADDYSLPYPDPPQPLRQFMAIDLWVFRDSNWSPDFPTSARQALSVYRPETPITPTGVIALDQYAAEQIIDVVGPLHIPGSEELVTGATLVDYIRKAWAPETEKFQMEWWLEHKSFMGDITTATLEKMGSGAVDWSRLIGTAMDLIEQRHIQMYVDNVDVAEFFKAQKWDSTIEFSSQDMLLFVDTNVGYNKVSMRIKRSLTYTVDLTQSPPAAELTLRMEHLSQNVTECEPEVRYYPYYEQSMERCYWSYLRFFVPEGAQLLEATELPIEAQKVLTGQSWPGIVVITHAEEGKATVFEQALLLPTASFADINFRYNLPDHVVQVLDDNLNVYRLVLQKQAGLRTIPTRVILRVPENALISGVLPAVDNSVGGVLVFDIDLQSNTEIELRYTVPAKESP